ncbi:hypothetical protein C2E21_8095 [Chlorella sorokiniana]|uniref:Uncharacterized protein n=1 Tax=Chlorella sorokiniana TaxID=3076 RepID=A0A2P6TG00_CHLSO|nr:hypothetical protein C2E21_8095 [Chlorella sorokiniana]|eukprot:PRW33043.1 hypothetical protein C2E21_8095 [Chlorella sorokiniana]
MPAVVPDPSKRPPKESWRDKQQRLAANEVQERECELLLERAEAAGAAAAAPLAARAAVGNALQPRVCAAALSAGGEAAEELECLQAEADALVDGLARALCADAELDGAMLARGWDSLLALQRGWAAAFPFPPATGLASDAMAALLDSVVVGRARQAAERARRQAEEVEEGTAALRATQAAGGTTALLRPGVQVRLESELTCLEWAAATAAREREWVDGRCAALQAEAARWEEAAAVAWGRRDEQEAGEAVVCKNACEFAAERLQAAIMALTSARSSLANSRWALQLMAGEARMASGLSELSRLRVAVTAVLASIAQDGPLAGSGGTIAPTLRLRMRGVAAAAAAGAEVLQEMREVAASGQGGPEAGADLAAAQAKAAAAADMLGQLAACLAASAGVELAPEEE